MHPLVIIAVLVSAGLGAAAGVSHAENQGFKQTQKILKTAPRTTTIPTTTIATPTSSALTSGECKGLGGSVVTNSNCAKDGMPTACKTVDADGVVRVMCIDGVKN